MREGCREGIYRADSCALCVGGRRVVCAGSAALLSVGNGAQVETGSTGGVVRWGKGVQTARGVVWVRYSEVISG